MRQKCSIKEVQDIRKVSAFSVYSCGNTIPVILQERDMLTLFRWYEHLRIASNEDVLEISKRLLAQNKEAYEVLTE